jgi:hypothetical protein
MAYDVISFILSTFLLVLLVRRKKPAMSAQQEDIAAAATASGTTTIFEHPSSKQVLEVKDILKQLRLPLEIIDVVIDLAEYWPCTVVSTGSETFFVGGSRNQDEFIVSANATNAAVRALQQPWLTYKGPYSTPRLL